MALAVAELGRLEDIAETYLGLILNETELEEEEEGEKGNSTESGCNMVMVESTQEKRAGYEINRGLTESRLERLI